MLAAQIRRFDFIVARIWRGRISLSLRCELRCATNGTLFWRYHWNCWFNVDVQLQFCSKYLYVRWSLYPDSHFVTVDANNGHHNFVAQVNALGFFPGQNQHTEIPFP